MEERQNGDQFIRRAQWSDRDELVRMLNTAFTRDETRPFDFLSFLPNVFTPERIGDHFIWVEDGRILGCVGLYPYRLRVRGVTFRVAGVGQVGTLPSARGRGIMTSLLKAACRDADAAGYDFCWLGGDRLRYGRHGWATGGVRMHFWISRRFLPEPAAGMNVRPFEADRDFELVRAHLADDPNTVVVDDAELRCILECPSTGGWVAGDAFVLYRRGIANIHAAGGTPEQIAALLSRHLQWLEAQPDSSGNANVYCAPAPSALMQACQRHYAGMSVEPSGMFRVGPLRAFLEKACRAAQARLSAGSGAVGLANADTGEAVTARCQDGRLSVEAGARGDVYRMGRRELSEACFGLCPLDVYLPGLPEDSFLRRVLPLPACWSRFFGV